LFTAAFSAGAGSSAGGIGYQEECAPTLKATASGSMMPSVLCLNDQGGSRMDVSEDVAATLRSQEHGHSPLVVGSQPELFENYGIDSRYTGPHKVAPTMSARYGTGGNNVPLISQPSVLLADSGEDSAPAETYCIAGNIIDRQDKNGGNDIGVQPDISYTVTATDRHCVFSQQRSDEYAPNEVVSTESARQYKDATDLVCETNEADVPETHAHAHRVRKLIRRLTPLECERLQGFPDHWTDIPGASDSARYKALGNSVAIPCVEHVLRGVACFLRKFKEESSCTSIRTT
jgi:DNA (cytosine-5)-methyltransferase 1